MSRITKSSNSPGSPSKEYFENADQQIPWPVEVGQKKDDYKGIIHVPHYDLDKANDNLMVSHLIHHGFVIQQTIAQISETKVFDPVIRLKDARPTVNNPEQSEFNIGDSYEVLSTNQILTISKIEREKITLEYVGHRKSDVTVPFDQLRRSLNFQTWKKI